MSWVSVAGIAVMAALSVSAHAIRVLHSKTYLYGGPPVFNNPKYRKAYWTLVLIVVLIAVSELALAIAALATE